jgi:hypothetical protein
VDAPLEEGADLGELGVATRVNAERSRFVLEELLPRALCDDEHTVALLRDRRLNVAQQTALTLELRTHTQRRRERARD